MVLRFNQNIIASGPQPVSETEGVGLLGWGAGLGLFAAAGFVPTATGRVWDKYLTGIRAVETGFPGGVLRTFRISEFLSPLESYSKVGVTSSELAGAGKYAEFLRSRFGAGISDIEFRSAGGIFGEVYSGGRAVGMGLQIQAGTQKGAAIADYYARITGTKLSDNQSLNDALLRAQFAVERPNIPYSEWVKGLGPGARQRLVIGAPFRPEINVLGAKFKLTPQWQRHLAQAETSLNLIRAKAATDTARLNMLLQQPAEIPVIGKYVSKIPFIKRLAVEPGTAMQMVGRYAAKGLMVAAAWKGIEYYDYLRASDSPGTAALGIAGGGLAGALLARGPGRGFSPAGLAIGAGIGLYTALAPRFDEGFLYGVASYGADINLARAHVSEAIGLTESLQRQEKVTPGLISLQTALGFAGAGALAGGFYSYGGFLVEAGKQRWKQGGALADIFETLRKTRTEKGLTGLWESGIGKAITKLPGGRFLSKIKSHIGLGAAAGLAAWTGLSTSLSLLSGNVSAAIPGVNLLGTKETPEELEAIYSGEQEIPVRKGRWWEMGRTRYEGGRVQYYRPHFLARLRTRAYQKGLYGSEEERWEHDPWLHPLKALFGSDDWKYHFEQKYQYERPAPITKPYGADIPFVGPIIAATIGKVLKPRKLVRPEEWMLGGGEYVYKSEDEDLEPVYELGGLGPGAPVAPDESTQLFNEMLYRRRETIGLVGFAEGAIQKAVTGREETFANQQMLAEMGEERGAEQWLFKHLNLGGGLTGTEVVRRFIPRTRSYLETYNPLAADVPSWYPRDYFIDPRTGNPFEKYPEYEIRGAGPGYAALHPELEGVHPEDYPLVHKLNILGDLFPWSKEYRHMMSFARRTMNQFSEQELAMLREIDRQNKEVKKRKDFAEYRFSTEGLESMPSTVSEVIDPRRIRTKETGDMIVEIQGMGAIQDMRQATQFARETLLGQEVTLKTPTLESRRYDMMTGGPRMKAAVMVDGSEYAQMLTAEGLAAQKDLEDEFEVLRYSPAERLAGRISETVLHGMESPLEYLTPFSPVAKLIHQRSPIEEYRRTETAGTGMAFWNKPVSHFLEPTAAMIKSKLGLGDISEQTQTKRDIEEYFDMLEWVKQSRLEQEARAIGYKKLAAKHNRAKRQTTFGVNPFGSPVNIIKALPRRERDYFNAFVEAQTIEERQEILSLVPENEQRIYLAQWMKQEEQAALAKRKAKMATQEDERTIITTKLMRKSDAFAYPNDFRVEEQWRAETNGKIPFDEWVRHKKAEEYFSTHSLPDPSWLGWHPSVDMEDVKAKYVDMAGLDHHDFDIWQDRMSMLRRKPYVNEELIEQMAAHSKHENVSRMRLNAEAYGKMLKGKNVRINQLNVGEDLDNEYNIRIRDGRKDLIERAYRTLGA